MTRLRLPTRRRALGYAVVATVWWAVCSLLASTAAIAHPDKYPWGWHAAALIAATGAAFAVGSYLLVEAAVAFARFADWAFREPANDPVKADDPRLTVTRRRHGHEYTDAERDRLLADLPAERRVPRDAAAKAAAALAHRRQHGDGTAPATGARRSPDECPHNRIDRSLTLTDPPKVQSDWCRECHTYWTGGRP